MGGSGTYIARSKNESLLPSIDYHTNQPFQEKKEQGTHSNRPL